MNLLNIKEYFHLLISRVFNLIGKLKEFKYFLEILFVQKYDINIFADIHNKSNI